MASNSTYAAMFETPQGNWITAQVKGTDYASPHFQWWELWNEKASTAVKLEVYQESWIFLKALEFLRVRRNKPFNLSCAYREKNYNAKVGGTANSLHLKMQAADIQLGAISNSEFEDWRNDIELTCYACTVNGKPLQAELGRYPWGLHVGFTIKLPYQYNGVVYVFDKRG